MRRLRSQDQLVPLSTRVPASLMQKLEELTPARSTLAETVRQLLSHAVDRDPVLMQFIADAFEQALAAQRRQLSGVLRLVLLNACHAEERDVREVLEKLEEEGLL